MSSPRPAPAPEDAPLNGDLSRRVLVHAESQPWQPSPGGTVWRKRLHRVGSVENGQVTSLVRFEPGSRFPEHGHPDGEEILVLDGTFSDETGSWGRGWYLVSPEGSRHSPYSSTGCTLFVKLQQLDGDGRPAVRLDTGDLSWWSTDNDGVTEKVLLRDPRFADRTVLQRWRAGARVERQCSGGLEIFVLDGTLEEAGDRLEAGSWLRLPAGATLSAYSESGCDLYLKDGGVSGLRDGAGR